MSDDAKDAIPAGYYLEQDKPGKVYRAFRQGPPMRVTECQDWEQGDAIVVEYEDMVKLMERDMFNADVDPTVRICLAVSDARFLVVGLIQALAGGGDVVAKKLEEALIEVREDDI